MPIDFETLRLKSSPNQYLVAPAGVCTADTPHRVLPDYGVPAGTLRDRFLAYVRRQPRIREAGGDPGQMLYEFVQRTPFLGFPDTITVQFFERGPAVSGVAIYSRSRYGYSDLGANKARIEEWLEEFDKELGG